VNGTDRLVQRVLLALLVGVLLASAAWAQGFDSPGGFGEADPSRTFKQVGPSSADRYFLHDQGVKIAVVGGLSILAVFLVAKRGFRHRKWLLLLSVGLVGFYLGGVLCPLASVQNILLKWNTAYPLLFLIPVVLALAVGRVFCGGVCPFGAAQELLHVRRWSARIPAAWRRGLGALKYAILLYLVTRVIVTGTSVLQGVTPFKVLFTWGGAPMAIGLTALTAGLSVVVWRPFCRFLCPLGALLSILSRFSLFRLEATSGCVSCGRCTAHCPAGACDGGNVRSADCFLCGDCVTSCPVASFRWVWRWSRRDRALQEGNAESSGRI